MALRFSDLFGKSSNYAAEYKGFKKALSRNLGDPELKSRFIKFCLMNRFTNHQTEEGHLAEALKLFETIERTGAFDLQCHYLVGKYYQEEKDYHKAYWVYLNAIKRFNQAAANDPHIRSEFSELAYSVSLNLMALQPSPMDPEVEVCFKIIRKSYPLHLKRIELESEMGKPAPDKARLKKLSEEMRKLKAEEEKEAPPQAVVEEKPAASPEPKQPEHKGIFSKLFNELSPSAMGVSGPDRRASKMAALEAGEKSDFFKISPIMDSPRSGSFLTFHNNQWEGPFTTHQLGSFGFLEPATWVCRAGSQQVLQAYEVPDLQHLLRK